MKSILINGAKYLGMHIFVIFISFMLSTLLGYVGGMVTFSVIMTILYAGIMMGMGYDHGKNDNAPFENITPSIKRCLLSCLLPSAVGIISVVLIALNIATENVSFVAKIWYIMYIGFFKYSEYARVIELVPMILSLPVAASIGYYLGMKNISIFENMDKSMSEKGKRRKEQQEKEHQRRVELERKKRLK